jgi:hypothetical protein
LDPDGPEPADDIFPVNPARGELWLRTRRNGRLTLEGWLNPEQGSVVGALIEQLATPHPSADGSPDSRGVPVRQADALIELCQRARTSKEFPTTGGEPPAPDRDHQWGSAAYRTWQLNTPDRPPPHGHTPRSDSAALPYLARAYQ